MPISYDKLWKLLIDKKMNRTDLKDASGISFNVLAIFLSKDESGLKIRSGALEYECPEYNILDIVAQNIDGGLDSIRKRWKRYEKTAVL